MTPHLSHPIAKALKQGDLDRAERRRLRRAARTGAAGPYGSGVIDALGHGLIAIGSRMVADRAEHPTHRRAA